MSVYGVCWGGEVVGMGEGGQWARMKGKALEGSRLWPALSMVTPKRWLTCPSGQAQLEPW